MLEKDQVKVEKLLDQHNGQEYSEVYCPLHHFYFRIVLHVVHQ